MSTPSGQASGPAADSGGQPGSTSTAEAPQGPPDSGEPSAETPSTTPDSAQDDPAPDDPAPEAPSGGTTEPAPPPDDHAESSDPDTAGGPPAEPGSDGAPHEGDTQEVPLPGEEPRAEAENSAIPGILPGADVTEVGEDRPPGPLSGEEVVPDDDEFKASVRKQAPPIETPASILDELGQQWRNAGADAEAAHADGSGGMDVVVQSWNDPALEELRRRTDPSLAETRSVRDSAGALDEQVRRAGEQARAAADGMERNIERQAPGYYLATATLPPGEREVAAQRIVDLTAAGNRDLANQAANSIANDPGWDRVEATATPAPPAPENPTPAVLAAASVGADAAASVATQRYAATMAAEGFDDVAGKVLKLGAFAGPALGLPIAIAGAAYDAHEAPPDNRESLTRAAVSNGAGWLASIAMGTAIGTPIGGVPGAVIGAVAGGIYGVATSGMVDAMFEHGTEDRNHLADGWNAVVDTGASLWKAVTP